ncbi:MAG: SOS response-associated peptidase [Saprospiraceae bacterium]|nr:MAG: SOS response-associated peptidase [Saprospiraceae bacterium]
MCGRFSLVTSKKKLQQELPFVETGDTFLVSYNIAPMQHAYVVTNDNPGRLQYITWGLVPHWSVNGKNTGRLINARREGIDGKPSFRIPIRKRRCLVPADSFYEWRKEGFKNTAYRIMMQNQGLLFFAGVWDVWYNGDSVVKTFSIITTAPNSEMAEIHNRMPVLLGTAEQRRQWLETTDIKEVLSLLQTPPDGILHIYRVSSLVNSVLNDSVELHKEVPEPPTLFV